METAEWRQLLNDNWDEIIVLISRYHPGDSQPTLQDSPPITARCAENACKKIREEIRKETKNDPVQLARLAKEEGDDEALWNIMNRTWFGVPESCYWPPGFGVLCDLCSEYEGPDEY